MEKPGSLPPNPLLNNPVMVIDAGRCHTPEGVRKMWSAVYANVNSFSSDGDRLLVRCATMLTPGPTNLVCSVGNVSPLHKAVGVMVFHESWIKRQKKRVLSLKLWSIRTSSSRQSVGVLVLPLYVELKPFSVVACGTIGSIACALGSIGTVLLGKYEPVAGFTGQLGKSVLLTALPAAGQTSLKMPWRSWLDGICVTLNVAGLISLRHSSLKKKKVFCLSRLYRCGIHTGPPMVYPKSFLCSTGTLSAKKFRALKSLFRTNSNRSP